MEVLFNKWWRRGLLRPSVNGLLTNCGAETPFVMKMMKVLKILKLVFEDDISSEMFPSKQIEDFVMNKRYVF